VCPKCKQPHQPSDAQLDAAGITPEMAATAKFMKGKGCGNCSKSGYRGRQGIFEMMMMTSKVRELAFSGAPSQELYRTAVSQGMVPLYHDGIRKALAGTTTIEEVFRVAKKPEV
jgi:type IV pilus assembly protein PilB